jgi:flagellar hook-associated protein 3 FlgL
MSLLPVITPRSSDRLQQQRLMYQVNADQTRLQGLYDQLSTGRRVLSGSDDPAAAARALGLSAGIARADQYARNAQATASYLQSADNSLGAINDVLVEARGSAVQSAQNVLTEDERMALVDQIDQMVNRLVTLGNESFQGTSLFGGALSREQTLTAELDGVVFRGNEALAQPKLASDTRVATLATGTEAMGLASPAVASEPHQRALTESTLLSDMRGGSGIAPGIVRLSDGSTWTEVDLRGSVTLGDIKNRIEGVELGGRALELTVGSDGVTLAYADGLHGTLGVDDAPGSSTSQQLNLHNPLAFTAPPLYGGGLAPRVTLNTPLSALNDGAGIDVSAGLRIEHGNERFDVDLSTAETVDDVLTSINRSEAEVWAELDETTGSIRLRLLKSGVDYSIGELGGDAATQLGIRTLTGETPLSALQRGRGPRLSGPGEDDLQIERPDGVVLGIDATGLTTVAEVIDAINTHPDNLDANAVVAELAPYGNGLRLSGPAGANPLVVRQPAESDFARALGLVPQGDDEVQGDDAGGVAELVGRDPAPVEPGGSIDTLLRLRRAVADEDLTEVERLSGRLEGDLRQASRARGGLGFRARAVERLQSSAEDQSVLMQSRLSEEVDADVAEVISQISSRQAAMEASLQLVGRTAGLTVLDFL